MRRLILAIIAIALSVPVFAPGTATAAPGDVTYPAPVPIVLTVVDPVIHVGDSTTVQGSGANPAENVSISGPDGSTTVVRADANGSFRLTLRFDVVGRFQIFATALTSGKSSSVTVTVLPAAATAGPVTATTTLAPTTLGSGLASTGASIAGPLIIGAVLLLGGGVLVLVGARMVARGRRKAPRH